MRMVKALVSMVVGSLLVLGGGVGLAQESEPATHDRSWCAPENFSATVWFTTDYVFRGLSQTDENPAVQASLDYVHPLGFYLGVWGSNTDVAPGTSVEIDLKAGFAKSWGNFKADVTAFYYAYPGADNDPEVDYVEGHLGLFYTFPVEWCVVPTVGVGYNYSPDFLYSDGDGHYVNGLVDLALPLGFGLGGEVGFQDVEGDESTGDGFGEDGGDGYDYWHWRVSLYKDFKGYFKLDLSYHDTDAEDFFGDIADERLVFTISRTF